MNLKKNIENITKNYSLGIIGGGQLALMLVEAANNRGIKVCVQTKSSNDPAGSKADYVIEADPLKVKGNKDLIKECEKIIFENEWIKIEKLNLVDSKNIFVPSLESIRPLVDRISQKKLIERLNLPTSRWKSIEEFKSQDYQEIENWNFPLMIKSYKGGYDGKGNRKINSQEDLNSFFVETNSKEWLIEEWVDYKNEFALVGSRDFDGTIRFFPLVETFQKNKVCDWVLSPAEIDYELKTFAINIFSSIVNELNYVGVMGIEFFYGDKGLLINEIAPRTHNSAHFSIEACSSSQFDQYVCISSGVKPPEINMHSQGSLMINLLGLKKNFPLSMKKRIELLSKIKGSNLHWYGKSKESLGRKMAHITFLLNEKNHSKRVEKSNEILIKVREIWPSPND
ncbi:5-(carboxyamino)imidazole ribonucleotide synthase [Prochlorococcus sp. AH-716-D22]|nr:5-(carboxyamino)imidazole ribonucleotide synthase [Prochlorococcus sp. AH-716-D22]